MRAIIHQPEPSQFASGADLDGFTEALAHALQAAGCEVVRAHWPQWPRTGADDVAIVLRGACPGPASGNGFRILWLLTHPADVDRAELDAHDLVIVGSRFHAELLAGCTETPVRVAGPCVDTRHFGPPPADGSAASGGREGVVYPVDSHGVRRPMAEWLAASRLPVQVYGRGWTAFGLDHLVEDAAPDASALAAALRRAQVALVDHLPQAAAFGYVNRRVLEALACGVPVVPDRDPGLDAGFSGDVEVVGSAAELEAAVHRRLQCGAEGHVRLREAWAATGDRFTFEARVTELLAWIREVRQSGVAGAGIGNTGAASIDHDGYRQPLLREQARMARLEGLLTDRDRQLERMQARERAALEEVRRATERVEVAEAERVETERRLTEIQSGLSWRVTRPLRMVREVVRMLARAWRRLTRDEVPGSASQRLRERLRRAVRELTPMPLRRAWRRLRGRPGADRFSGQAVVDTQTGGAASGPSVPEGRYWRLQAIQLLEELEYARGGDTDAHAAGGSRRTGESER